jgi:hypothetical protein
MPFHRLTVFAWAILVAMLPACDTSNTQATSAETMVADTMAEGQAPVDPTVMEIADENAIDIGDVEQGVRIIGLLTATSTSENIVQTVIRDKRDRITLVNITVNPPNPGTLWIGVRMACTRDFVERPVVLDTKVLVDGRLMDTFTAVLAEGAQENRMQRNVEVLFGLDEIPETMLVSMESEALLLPEGTDITTIDPYSITEGQRTKAISHAPVRIDFSSPGPKPSTETPGTDPS